MPQMPVRQPSGRLHHWHNDMDFNPNNTIEELEDGTARVLAVLEGHTGKELARNPSGQLM